MMHRQHSPMLALSAILLALLACSFETQAQRPATPESASPTPIQAADTPASGANPSPSDECTNAMYPVTQGATWSYTITSTGEVPGAYIRTITDLTATGFTDQDVFSTGVTHTGQWQCDDGGFLALQVDDITGPIPSPDLTADFQTTEVSGVTVPNDLVPGATWKQGITVEGTGSMNGQNVKATNAVIMDCVAGHMEAISVPADMFHAVRADCMINQKITLGGVGSPTDITSTVTVWYASGVGMVKRTEAITNGPTIAVELTAYKIP